MVFAAMAAAVVGTTSVGMEPQLCVATGRLANLIMGGQFRKRTMKIMKFSTPLGPAKQAMLTLTTNQVEKAR